MAGIKNSYRSEESNRLFKEPEYKIVNNKVIRFSDVAVHKFNMGDIDDPDLYASQPLLQWQSSEAGQWVMTRAVDTPFWHRVVDPYSYGWTYYIIARLSDQDQTFWSLKWKNN